MKMTTDHSPGPSAGFTLIEILLAVAITAMIMTLVGGSFLALLQARNEVNAMSESTTAGPRILASLERDLRGLWHHNVKDNRVLIGKNHHISGNDADRIDFVSTTDAVGLIVDVEGNPRRPSICEVSYWLRENPRYPQLIELWRREDPMLDDELQDGGTFQLVHDRMRMFNITYYKELGVHAEEFVEWDSSDQHMLPRRIKIEFTVERKLPNRNQVTGSEIGDIEETLKKYTRHIVFDRRYPRILQGGIALLPALPGPPQAEGPVGGGGGGKGGAKGGGKGGRGGKGKGGRGGKGNQRGRGAKGRGGRGNQIAGKGGKGRGQGGRGKGNPGGGRGGQPPGGFSSFSQQGSTGLPPSGTTINFQELFSGGGGAGGLGGSGGMQGLFGSVGSGN